MAPGALFRYSPFGQMMVSCACQRAVPAKPSGIRSIRLRHGYFCRSCAVTAVVRELILAYTQHLLQNRVVGKMRLVGATKLEIIAATAKRYRYLTATEETAAAKQARLIFGGN